MYVSHIPQILRQTCDGSATVQFSWHSDVSATSAKRIVQVCPTVFCVYFWVFTNTRFQMNSTLNSRLLNTGIVKNAKVCDWVTQIYALFVESYEPLNVNDAIANKTHLSTSSGSECEMNIT